MNVSVFTNRPIKTETAGHMSGIENHTWQHDLKSYPGTSKTHTTEVQLLAPKQDMAE